MKSLKEEIHRFYSIKLTVLVATQDFSIVLIKAVLGLEQLTAVVELMLPV